jgi:tetratricopeptide (TPR) repeat protein
VPALLAPAVCLPLAVMRARSRGRPLRAGPGAAAALAVVGIGAMVMPYLSALYVERGDNLLAADPRAAIVEYDRAASVNPVAVEPHLSSGFAALRLRDAALARGSFKATLDVREDWVARFELGLLDAQAGRRRPALAQLERAAQLNRNDDVVTDAIAAVRKGKRLDPLEVNRSVLSQPVLAAPP